MGRLFRIDLTSLPTHQERHDVCNLLSHYDFEVSEHWIPLDESHKTIDYINVFWELQTDPVFPALPEHVKITQL